ncbi:Nucleotidyltransferase domain-containing protein [Desulfurobacterium pacificum]|uniref:Nucleotidyltransferase domain-containing protein n=1 Tax=Desulfurobacterium pacificum TaxID=240166 RepID=A0ABY1NLL4_9BACT|nr:nucleotidyltransferase domain-containing protein [Desulfurobacterium pacificum]SMP12734.1 Nucleotidyltransferase domain-containing protein [Desulfurobacterium pacificum]
MGEKVKFIRLSKEDIKKIKETAEEVFGRGVKVYIFGSRTISDKRGGDIDILIKTEKDVSTDDELSFLAKLELKGIERKVDLIVVSPKTKLKSIHLEAMRTGVEI